MEIEKEDEFNLIIFNFVQIDQTKNKIKKFKISRKT